MKNINLAVGMVVFCDFNKSEKRLLKKIKRRVIRKLKLRKDDFSQAVEELYKIFDDKDTKELTKEQLKPEMWKKRPVLVIHLYEREGMQNSALVLPLTTAKPRDKSTVFWLSDKKPKIMGKENSWVICDIPCHVSTDRLTQIMDDNESPVFIDAETYRRAIEKYKKMVADNIPKSI